MFGEIGSVISRLFASQPIKIDAAHSVYVCCWFGTAVIVEDNQQVSEEKVVDCSSQRKGPEVLLRLVYSSSKQPVRHSPA